MQGLTEDDLIDFTPELRAEALEIIKNYKLGPLFNPPIQVGHPSGLRSFVSCPSGASNIYGPNSADPETGILYVASLRGCRSENIVPGREMDDPEDIMTTGRTISDWAVANRGDFRGPQGLPIFKPPYSKITAIDMNTGEHLWWIPNRRHARPYQEPRGAHGSGSARDGGHFSPGDDGHGEPAPHRGGHRRTAGPSCR